MAKKEIKFTIELDDHNIPERIRWEASDAPEKGAKTCTSLMVYMWDKEARNSLSIELWTPEMLIPHMNMHFIHNFMRMADVYRRATKNETIARMIEEFARDFADKVKEVYRK